MIVAQSNQTYDLRGQVIPVDPNEDTAMLILGVENVRVIGGTFVGSGLPWYEWRMMIKVLGAHNVVIEGTQFTDPVGDAVYIDDFSDTVDITDCSFFGSGQNRCGVGLICGSNVRILRNGFVGMSRPDMPGAIDLEPDTADQQIWNVVIDSNYIEGGNGRAVQLYNGIAHCPNIGEITIQHNSIRGPREVAVGCWGSPNVTEGRVTVRGNDITGATTPLAVSDMAVDSDITGVIEKNKRKHRRHKRRKR